MPFETGGGPTRCRTDRSGIEHAVRPYSSAAGKLGKLRELPCHELLRRPAPPMPIVDDAEYNSQLLRLLCSPGDDCGVGRLCAARRGL